MISSPTICAVATAPGVGGIAVIRISGAEALSLASAHLFAQGKSIDLETRPPRRAVYAEWYSDGVLLDDVVVLPFRAPHSYTGEDVVEVSCHGSSYIVQSILDSLVASGAQIARPGEFTQRAYLNGRMDLAQAEAVADIIASETAVQHRIAVQQMRGGYSARLGDLRSELLRLTSLMELELDFPEEDVEFADRSELRQLVTEVKRQVKRLADSYRLGNAIKHGVPVALIGATNVGKSTLLNTLMGEERAIVSDIHGTTRDTIEDNLTIGGYQFRFIDTAGLRQTSDHIEELGIERSRSKMREAQIVLLLVDPLRMKDEEQEIVLKEVVNSALSAQVLVLINKTDLVEPEALEQVQHELMARGFTREQLLSVVARQDESVDVLRQRLVALMEIGENRQSDILVNNARHYQLLVEVDTALQRLDEGFTYGTPTDLLTLELRTAIRAIGDITGQQISSEDTLHYIFAHFCIGK